MKSGMVESTIKAGVGQFVGLLLGAISVKLLAVLAGPAGVGLFSILRQLQQTLSAVAALGGQNAVVQGLSSREGEERQSFLVSSFYMFLLAILVSSIALLFFAEELSEWALDGAHATAIRWLVIPIALGSFLFYFRGLLIAEMQFGAVALVNIAVGLGGAIAALPVGLAYAKGGADALVLMVGGGVFFGTTAALICVRRLGGFQSLSGISFRYFSKASSREFLFVALPSLLSIFFTMGSVLIIRGYVVNYAGLEGAGFFDAAWSITAMYLALFLGSLQSWLLPELSQKNAGVDIQKVIIKALHFSLLISLPIVTCLIVMKPLVIRLLFSGEFLESLKVLRWMQLGDYVRVLGWVISTALVARADMRAFFAGEALWSIAFLILAIAFLGAGLEWVGLAYLLAYLIYVFFLLWRLFATHAVRIPMRHVLHWLGGGILVGGVSYLSWDETALYSWHIVLILPSILFSFMIMRSDEKIFARQFVSRTFLRVKRIFLGS